MSFRREGLLGAACAALLLAASCGTSGSDDESGAAGAEDATAAEVADGPDGAGDEEDGEDEVEEVSDEPLIEPMEIGETVQYAGFVFEVQDLEVDDVGVDDPAAFTPLGLTFNLSVENTQPTSGTPNVNVSLQWDDEGDDVVEVSGSTGFREIPGNASSRGTIEFQVMPADLETWDGDSARLVLGRSGEATAVIPLGDEGEVVPRTPVPQDIQQDLDLAGFEVEVEGAVVRWDLPGAGQQVAEGTAILEFSAVITNGTDGQQCFRASRGGIGASIVLLDGTSRTVLDTNMNCLSSDEVERDAKFAFEIDDPFAGEYTVTLESGSLDGAVEFTFTLLDGDGAAVEEDDEDDGGGDEDEDVVDEDDED